MRLLANKLKITLKATLPTYILITLFTLFFLGPGSTMLGFSRFGESLASKLLFSLAFNLLYFIPQSSGIFIALHTLRSRKDEKITAKKAKWFLRIPAPVTVLATTILSMIYYAMNFFPDDVNKRNLYFLFMIVIFMNALFSLVMSLNIYATLKNKIEAKKERSSR